MKNKFDSISKNLLVNFFQKEFKSSRELTLRLSLIESDVRKDLLINDGLDVLFENPYFVELLQICRERSQDAELTQKELVFSDIHNFQVFLHAAKTSGFKVSEAGNSETIFSNQPHIEFQGTSYLITLVRVEDCVGFVDALYNDLGDDDFYSMLVFLSSHLEFQI